MLIKQVAVVAAVAVRNNTKWPNWRQYEAEEISEQVFDRGLRHKTRSKIKWGDRSYDKISREEAEAVQRIMLKVKCIEV